MSWHFNINLLGHQSVVFSDIIDGPPAGKQLDERSCTLARIELQDGWVESVRQDSLKETDRKSSLIPNSYVNVLDVYSAVSQQILDRAVRADSCYRWTHPRSVDVQTE